MKPLEYHRPKSIEEALPLLWEGQPLAGGTHLVPRRARLHSLVDLQDLGLEGIEYEDGEIRVGATTKLQSLVAHGEPIPPALAEVCRKEVGLNLRNMASIAGTVVASDGRSPVVTTLLALGATAILKPGDEVLSLDELLDRRGKELRGRLIVAVRIPMPEYLVYEQVARAPADRPLVCSAVAGFQAKQPGHGYRVALGGYGERPLLLKTADDSPERAVDAASAAYASAGDVWASAEYRSAVAGVLVRRLLAEVVG